MKNLILIIIFILSENLISSTNETNTCIDSMLNYIVNQKEVILSHFELECQNKSIYKLIDSTVFLEERDIATKYFNFFGKIYGTKTKSELYFKYKEIYKARKANFVSFKLPNNLNFNNDIISYNNNNQPLTIKIDKVSDFYYIANIEVHEFNKCKLNSFKSLIVYLIIYDNEFNYFIHHLVY